MSRRPTGLSSQRQRDGSGFDALGRPMPITVVALNFCSVGSNVSKRGLRLGQSPKHALDGRAGAAPPPGVASRPVSVPPRAERTSRFVLRSHRSVPRSQCPRSTMDVRELSDEEFAHRGNAIFEEQVLPNIDDPEAKARHFVVIDIKTGEYEVSETPIHSSDATQRLLERCPGAKGRIWTRRVGSPVAHHMGGTHSAGRRGYTMTIGTVDASGESRQPSGHSPWRGLFQRENSRGEDCTDDRSEQSERKRVHLCRRCVKK